MCLLKEASRNKTINSVCRKNLCLEFCTTDLELSVGNQALHSSYRRLAKNWNHDIESWKKEKKSFWHQIKLSLKHKSLALVSHYSDHLKKRLSVKMKRKRI